MKSIIKCFINCCVSSNDKESEEKNDQDIEEIKKTEKPKEPLKNSSFEEPDKERTPESDLTDIKEKKFLTVGKSRPSIILSMDGSEHHVVLYEDNIPKKKKRSKHKKKKKKIQKN